MPNVNNEFYNELHEGWFYRENHPIALLRQENQVRNPWIKNILTQKLGQPLTVLDIGCGAGLLTSDLAVDHQVYGIDLSEPSILAARSKDPEQKIHYQVADAGKLPFEANQFDAVFAMDLLEHVDHPAAVINEAARVLKPQGLFFFHTFNRNLLSYLIIIKAVEFFVPNTPPRMHCYHQFIKPQELKGMLSQSHLSVQLMQGLQPKIFSLGVVDLLWKRKVTQRFQFQINPSLSTGYMGYAIKTG